MAVKSSSADWNLHPRSFSFKRGFRKKPHGARSGKYGGCAKRWPVALPIPLGQVHTDVLGRWRVATANSCCAKGQDAYYKLNWVDGEGCSCKSACLQVAFVGIPDEPRNSLSITLPFDLSCAVPPPFRGENGDFNVANCCLSWGLYKKIWFFLCYDPVEKLPIISSTMIRSSQTVMLSSRCSYVKIRGTLCCVTHDMFRSSNRILWLVLWLHLLREHVPTGTA